MPAGVAELTHNNTVHTASSRNHTGNSIHSQINYNLYIYTGFFFFFTSLHWKTNGEQPSTEDSIQSVEKNSI